MAGSSGRRGPFVVSDAKGVPLAYVPCRDDLQGVIYAHNHLTSEEARRIANGIARLPEFMMQRKDFHPEAAVNIGGRNRGPITSRLKTATFARIGDSSKRFAR